MSAPDEPAEAPAALGRVQRVDAPQPTLVIFEVYRREGDEGVRRRLALRCAGGRGNVLLLAERPAGDPADGFVRRLRKLLVGAYAHPEQAGSMERIRFDSKSGELALFCETDGPVLRRLDDGHPLAARRRIAKRELPKLQWEPLPLRPAEVDAPPPPEEEPRRRALLRALSGHERRLQRKAEAIAHDAARATEAPSLRARAQGLLANAHSWTRGDTTLEIVDFLAEPPEIRRIEVDPREGPAKSADRLFHRAKRLERGQSLSAERIAAVQRELDRVAELRASVDEAPTEALDEHEAQVRALSPQVAQRLAAAGPRRARRAATRMPYRLFRSGGRVILVGRSAADNDALTLGHAKPHDLWLHARGVTGAHVVVPLGRSEECPPELLIDAALLAAHFSDAPNDEVTEVQHVRRRYVRKRRGSPPGAVFVDRERVVLLRPDPARLRALLDHEGAPDGAHDRSPL